MGERSVKKIEKSKDGAPCWDGDSSTFAEYSELDQYSSPVHPGQGAQLGLLSSWRPGAPGPLEVQPRPPPDVRDERLHGKILQIQQTQTFRDDERVYHAQD